MAKRQTRPLTPAEAVRQGRKLIAERRRQEAAQKAAMRPESAAQPEPMPIFPTALEVPKIDTHPYGAWPLTELRARQCRFACTADDVPRDQHRFCGRRTFVGPRNLDASWCDEHLVRVWGTGTVSERNAHHVTKDVRRFG